MCRWAAVTHGDVLAGLASPEELVPFGGELAHKAFALAVGLELLVGALAGEEHGAVLVVAQPGARSGAGVPRSRGRAPATRRLTDRPRARPPRAPALQRAS